MYGAAAEFRKIAQLALSEARQEVRRASSDKLPSPPHPTQQGSAEESEEEAATGRVPEGDPRTTLHRTPKMQQAARNELCTLLSPIDTNKRATKKKEKKPVVKPRQY